MKETPLKQEAVGTRSGYIIRYTCPSCHHDNSIINKTPKECYRESRYATCHQCKKHYTVTTPDMFGKVYSPL